MSSGLTDQQAYEYIIKLLTAMSKSGGSDLFISNDFPPSMKAHGEMQPMTAQKLNGEVTRHLAHALMNEDQRAEFEKEMECNFAISVPGVSRFRVNVFVQQQNVGMVIRTIAAEIPNFEKLGLPEVLKEVIMNKRGLVLVVGGTGSGKSTSLAAMIDHRNRTSKGHIITVEDPVEYVHQSKQVADHPPRSGGGHAQLASRAEEHAAPGAGRDPDRRDPRCRDHGARHRLRRDRPPVPGHAARQQRQPDHRPHHQLLPRRAAQPAADGPFRQPARASSRSAWSAREDGKGRKAAIEILLNTPTIADKIFKGEFNEIKGIMEKSRELGMRTFDWSLFELYNDGHISYEEAIRNADSANELRLNIKLKSKRGEPASASAGADLSLHEYKSPEELEAERQAELAAQEEHKRQFEAEQLAKQKQEAAKVEKPQPAIPLDKLQLSLE